MKLPGIALLRLTTLNDNELIELVAEKLCQMYTPPVSVPTRNIPAQPNGDFDILVSELILRFKDLKESYK